MMSDGARKLGIQPGGVGQLEQRAPRIDPGNHGRGFERLAAVEHDAVSPPAFHQDFFDFRSPEFHARPLPQAGAEIGVRRTEDPFRAVPT